jgi:regulator of replication initiation timing
MNEIREAIKRDLIRDETNLLDQQMKDVRRGVEELKAKNATLQIENDQLRRVNHEAEVTHRVLKWVLSKNVVIARNADQQMYLRDFHTGRPAAIPDVYARTVFEIVREVELEAEHAG